MRKAIVFISPELHISFTEGESNVDNIQQVFTPLGLPYIQITYKDGRVDKYIHVPFLLTTTTPQ